MKKVERSEILSIGEYEPIREHFRARVIREKKARRVRVSDIISVTFENHDTVLLQIQEMLRTERITSEDGIAHEIETYNELVPEEGFLSVTLFVEIPEKEKRERTLIELLGLEKHLFLEVDGEKSPAIGERVVGEITERTTAVHYLKFQLSAQARGAFISQKAKVALVIDHPAHKSRADFGPETMRSLASDLK